MDWNWFFSTLAQSTAAIVGLFGAFIITKIIGNEAEFKRKKNVFLDLITKSETLYDEAKTKNDDFDFCINMKFLQVKKEIYNKLGPNEIKNSEELYNNYRRSLSLFQSKEDAISRFGKLGHDGLDSVSIGFEIATLQENYGNKEKEINNLIIRIQEHCRSIGFAKFGYSGDPESSSLVTWALIITSALFFIGVIYPLSFLPMAGDLQIDLSFNECLKAFYTFKGVVLSVVSAIFLIMISIFMIRNLKYKYDRYTMQNLEKYEKLSYYSEFLKNMHENQIKNLEEDIEARKMTSMPT